MSEVLPRKVFPEGLMSSCRTDMSNTLLRTAFRIVEVECILRAKQ